MDIEIVDDAPMLARCGVQAFISVLKDTLAKQDRFSVLLSGGRTPQALYSLLGSSEFRDEVPWQKIFFFWGDERFVPPTHPDSNYRMVHEALLGHVPIPAQNIIKVPTEMLEAKQVAETYEKRIREFFHQSAGIPSFDFALMGMGADGHTASLFPDSDYRQLSRGETLVIAPFVTHLKAYRISLTLKVFNACKNVVFAVAGRDKLKVFDQIRHGQEFPAGLVQPQSGKLKWLVVREVVAD